MKELEEIKARGPSYAVSAAELDTLESLLEAKDKRIAELEARPPVPTPPQTEFLWRDDFTSPPKDVDAGGPYVLDGPSSAFMAAGGFLGVTCRTSQSLDANGTRKRSEFGLLEPGAKARIYRRDPYGVVRWYAMRLRFPKQNFPDPNKLVVMQWHGGPPDPGDKANRNPPLSLEFLGKDGVLRFVTAPLETTQRQVVWKLEGPVDPDLWYSFVVNAVWDGTGNHGGRINAWLNESEILRLAGKNAYDDKAAYTFFRAGAYWPAATDPQTRDSLPSGAFHEVHFQNLRLGDERHALKDFT